jgi:hypothetical protein
MTEVEWLACPERDRLLDHAMPRLGPRKLRLFSCAVGRRVWPLLTDPRSCRAVEVAELISEEVGYGDGGWRKHSDLCWAAADAAHAAEEEALSPARQARARAAWLTLATARFAIPYHVKYHAAFVVGIGAETRHVEGLFQCRLVRDLCGNPFRSVAVDPNWRRWHDDTVAKMARIIYDEQRFDDLPILADALEDAGCDNANILAHCRGPGPHVRGCWVVDLLLGKD